jgi:hypothetical protein
MRSYALCLPILALIGCRTDDGNDDLHGLVIAIDRTGVAQADTWQAEVAAQTQVALETAMDEGVDQVALLSIGSNTDQTATVATADLTAIEGNTEAKREAARQTLIADIASAAAQVASRPVDTAGTDVFAALNQAASLCQAPDVTECSVLVFSDLEDLRVLAALSREAAVDELGDFMPDLTGVSVQVAGLGASGADASTVQTVRAAWLALFEQAGAVGVRIARSL